ncbi:MAG: class II aldolase/adducin family protein [bacterium]
MEDELRREMVEYCKLLYDRRLTVSSDGNLSTKVGGGQILITSDACCFGTIEECHIVKIDFLGNVLQGDAPPSSEFRMHVEAYKRRKDVQAVVHTHSPYAAAFAAIDGELEPILSELAIFGGRIPKTGYAPPHTEELAHAISKLVENHDAILLRNHGALAMGGSIREAFLTAERLEFVAQVAAIARQMGGLRKLSREQLARLDAILKA